MLMGRESGTRENELIIGFFVMVQKAQVQIGVEDGLESSWLFQSIYNVHNHITIMNANYSLVQYL